MTSKITNASHFSPFVSEILPCFQLLSILVDHAFRDLNDYLGNCGSRDVLAHQNFNRSRESQAGDFSASCSHFAFAFSTTLISTSVVGFTIHSSGCGHPSANEPDEDSKAVEATEGYHVFCCHSRTESARPPVLGIAQGRDRCKVIFLHGSTAEVPGSPELSLYSEMHCRWIYFAAQHLCTSRSLPNRPADRMPHAR